MYVVDVWHLGVDAEVVAYLEEVGPQIISDTVMQEMRAIADMLGEPVGQVLLANLHYDLLKYVLGCTAFAVDHPAGPLHARNLDWWTEGSALSEYTVVTKFLHGPCGEFLTVGWPGFVGAFSGMARGRFSVSLNAVLSEAAPEVATPVVFLIRDVLERTPDFDAAVMRLAETPIASDCLLLVTGIRAGEAVVLERTPGDVVYRNPRPARPLAVTNEYVAFDADLVAPTTELMATSGSRQARVETLLKMTPRTMAGCLEYLSDDGVLMGITVQQMVFQAATGTYLVRLPS